MRDKQKQGAPYINKSQIEHTKPYGYIYNHGFHTNDTKSSMIFNYANMNMPFSYIKEINDFKIFLGVLKFYNIKNK